MKDTDVEKLWRELENVPFDYPQEAREDMTLGEDWHIFKKGTNRNDIWKWFNQNHSKGVSYLLYEYEM